MDRTRRPEIGDTGETREVRETRELQGEAHHRTPESLSDLAKRTPIAWRDLERLDSKLGDRYLDPAERTRLKDIKHWRLTRPRPELPSSDQDEVVSIAMDYGEAPARVEELARDPDHSGAATPNSFVEARIALAMEREGKLRDVVRDPRRDCGDLIEDDGAGQEWDVVSFRGARFQAGQVLRKMQDKLERQRKDDRMMKVIVNTAYLSAGQVAEVKEIVAGHGWSTVVTYGSSGEQTGVRSHEG